MTPPATGGRGSSPATGSGRGAASGRGSGCAPGRGVPAEPLPPPPPPPRTPEKRVDPADGNSYTQEEFQNAYVGNSEWEAAKPPQQLVMDDAAGSGADGAAALVHSLGPVVGVLLETRKLARDMDSIGHMAAERDAYDEPILQLKMKQSRFQAAAVDAKNKAQSLRSKKPEGWETQEKAELKAQTTAEEEAKKVGEELDPLEKKRKRAADLGDSLCKKHGMTSPAAKLARKAMIGEDLIAKTSLVSFDKATAAAAAGIAAAAETE